MRDLQTHMQHKQIIMFERLAVTSNKDTKNT
jgi:hypothetical protein